jgi:hypothetical protein
MIDGKKTDREERMEKEILNYDWEAEVLNEEDIDATGTEVKLATFFNSDIDKTLDAILHKIKLDLMTNLKYGFEKPIRVRIRKIKKIVADEMHRKI